MSVSRYVVNVVRIPPYRGLIIFTFDDINGFLRFRLHLRSPCGPMESSCRPAM
jgi:hypothetical protein